MLLREDILAPIEGENPAGPSLRYDPVYDQLKEARTEVRVPEDPSNPRSKWVIQKAPDWSRVVELTEEALATRSKDLQLAVWLTEGLTRTQGFQGLREGLILVRQLQEEFWEGLHPEMDEGELDYRAAPLEWLGGGSVRETRGRDNIFEHFAAHAPLTRSGLTYAHFYVADYAGREDETDAEKKERRAALIADKQPTIELWEGAVRETPKEFMREVLEELRGCQEALTALKALCEERYLPVMGASEAPGFGQLEGAIQAARRIAERMLKARLETEPDPLPVEEPESVESMAGGGGKEGEGEAPTEGGEGVLTPEPTSRKDAAGRVAAVARFLRKEDPRDPTPYVLIRTMAWGELRALAPAVDPKLLEPPPTPLRTRLRSLILDGKWAQVLETSEEVMATPYGRGWLDLQRYALEAAGSLGPDYDGVGNAIRSQLRELLLDLPDLPRLSLMDDSPVANPETRGWIRQLGLSRGEEGGGEEIALAPRGGGRDVFAAAMERVKAGEPQKGIQLLMREAAQEKSARARFLRRMEAAEIMLDHGLAQVAHPILREMLDQIQSHNLEEWESGETVARALGLLYRALEILGDNEGIRPNLYLRVCRLDPMQAINFGMTGNGS